MGLFDRLMRKASVPTVPEPVEAESAPGVVCAPVSGRACAMSEVPDPAFGSGAMGAGCGVWPEGEVVFAPVTGTVNVMMSHAVGITGDDGCEVLVHVGIDTVDMNGSGFGGLVGQGERVEAGQPLLRFSREKIHEAGHPDVVVLVVTNTADYESVDMSVPEGETVAAGAVVVRVTK